jgi:hypothetical protein
MELPQYQLVDLITLFTHDLVEHRRLDIGQYDPLKKLKYSSLNQLSPINGDLSLLFFEFSQDVGDDALVGLLVKLSELYRPHMVIPSLNTRSLKQTGNQSLGDHGNSVSNSGLKQSL